MKKVISLFLIIGLILLFSCNNSEIKENQKFEDGVSYTTKVGGYTVLSLNGDWYQMGRQYGELAKNRLREFYKKIHEDLINRGIDSLKQLNLAKESYDNYSTEMKDLVKGMSETSGLNLNQHIILDASFYLLTGAILQGHPPVACSGIAVTPPRTTDGKVLFGRNWDINRKAMIGYMKYLSAVVFNPDKGSSFVNVRPLGQVYVETGFNSKGIFIELNNGEASDTCDYPNRRFSAEVIFDILNKSNTLNEAVSDLQSIPAETAYIIQVVDSQTAVSVERATFDSRVLKPQNGLLVAYNSFIEPYPENWQTKLMPPPPPTQDPRRQNILNLFNEPEWQKNITVKKILKIMDLEIGESGAVHDGTVIQTVIVPADYELYFRGYKYSDWARINLKKLFINQ